MTRLWVDANVILRFLVREPEEMAAQAARLLERAEAGKVQLFLSPLVLAEIFWVLKSFYKHPLNAIRDHLIPLVSHPGIQVEDLPATLEALDLTSRHNVDFADAYLAVQAAAAGETVCSFDETDFHRLPAGWLTPDEASRSF